MVYSEVVNAGFILPSKALYTMKDVDKVLVGGLFNKSESL
jgi:translation initiation factor 2B subunit (eIF-2B alpha/beta/delta family)